MFESAFALETPGRRSPLLISFLIQSATITVMLLIPLYYVEQLTVMPTMPVPVYTPKLPHMKIISVVREAASAMTPRLTTTRLPDLRLPIRPLENTGRIITDVGPMPTVFTGPGIAVDLPIAAQPRIAPAPAPPEVKPKPAPRQAPVSVGGDVQNARLIHKVKPAYPPLAKQVRIQGMVRLQAIIARDGTIQNLTLVSGHPLLVPAALEAVRQWRYQPTTLNGQVVEVMTQIDVNFTLSQ
jgi:protein TonB